MVAPVRCGSFASPVAISASDPVFRQATPDTAEFAPVAVLFNGKLCVIAASRP
jgi:hypothetical protein